MDFLFYVLEEIGFLLKTVLFITIPLSTLLCLFYLFGINLGYAVLLWFLLVVLIGPLYGEYLINKRNKG